MVEEVVQHHTLQGLAIVVLVVIVTGVEVVAVVVALTPQLALPETVGPGATVELPPDLVVEVEQA